VKLATCRSKKHCKLTKAAKEPLTDTMVTWGPNQTHVFGSAPATPATGGPAGTGFSFGSSSPAPSFAFGSTPSNTPAAGSSGFSFGSPAPPTTGFGAASPAPSGGLFGNAPSSGSLFGPKPAPAGGSLFGTPSSGGLFGGTPSSGGLFGSTPSAPGLFGSTPSTPGFGTPQQQQPQQLPYQAALQAHLHAEAQQEQTRIKNALSKIHESYNGTRAAGEKSSDFVTILYNPATPEYQQLQWLHGMAGGGNGPQAPPTTRPVAPPRPLQVAEREWEQAVVRNPNHQIYMPAALVGAESLQARLASQQERASSLVDQLKTLQKARENIEKDHELTKTRLTEVQRRQIRQRQKLLDIMQRVEIFRCYTNPLQPDEINAMQKAGNLFQEAERLTIAMRKLESLVQHNASGEYEEKPVTETMKVDEAQLKENLTRHREDIQKLVTTVDRDARDLELISNRLV